jgi:hypothetical protein
MKYKNLGCFTAADGAGMNPAVSELLFNEISPSIDNFNGNMLMFDDSWETAYPQLLCRCARAAEQKGYDVFAIRNKGMCFCALIHFHCTSFKLFPTARLPLLNKCFHAFLYVCTPTLNQFFNTIIYVCTPTLNQYFNTILYVCIV